jgi:hypothetical protein
MIPTAEVCGTVEITSRSGTLELFDPDDAGRVTGMRSSRSARQTETRLLFHTLVLAKELYQIAHGQSEVGEIRNGSADAAPLISVAESLFAREGPSSVAATEALNEQRRIASISY